MTSALFLGFLALMATIVVVLVYRYLNRRIASGVATGLVIWFIYAGLLGYLGIFKSTTTRPPGIALGVADNRAMLWSGSAGSAVDLQSLLPDSGNWSSSEAYSIDDSGNIYGEAYGTYNGITDAFAVEWSASNVPEPATGALLAICAPALLRRRRCR
jgi:hypothetical protein